MSRSAASAALPKTDFEERSSAADLLADGAFQARLAKARSDRERALADLGGEDAPLRRRKPWERHAARRSQPTQHDTVPEGPLILTEKDRLKTAMILATGGSPRPSHPSTEPDARDRVPDRELRRRKGSLLVAGGFVAGLVIGAGVTSLISYSSAPPPLSGAVVTDDRVAMAMTSSDAVSAPYAAAPVATEDAGAASATSGPALDEAPVVFTEGPRLVLTAAALQTPPAIPIAADRGVAFETSPSLAPPPGPDRDVTLPKRALPASTASAGYPQAVFVHAPSGVAKTAVEDVLGTLDRVGFTIADTRRVRFSISRSNVRYFHAADAAAANRLAEEIDAVARDFTAYRPSPPGGTIEVWLEGRSPGSRRSAPSPQQAERDEQLLFLRRFIIEKLRAAGNPRP